MSVFLNATLRAGVDLSVNLRHSATALPRAWVESDVTPPAPTFISKARDAITHSVQRALAVGETVLPGVAQLRASRPVQNANRAAEGIATSVAQAVTGLGMMNAALVQELLPKTLTNVLTHPQIVQQLSTLTAGASRVVTDMATELQHSHQDVTQGFNYVATHPVEVATHAWNTFDTNVLNNTLETPDDWFRGFKTATDVGLALGLARAVPALGAMRLPTVGPIALGKPQAPVVASTAWANALERTAALAAQHPERFNGALPGAPGWLKVGYNHPRPLEVGEAGTLTGRAAQAPGIVNANAWVQIGSQPKEASTLGGKFKDRRTGSQYYVKFPGEEKARLQVLVSKLYAAAGIDVVPWFLVSRNGPIGIASVFHGDLQPIRWYSGEASAFVQAAREGYATDIWVFNSDLATYGNIRHRDGSLVRVDVEPKILYNSIKDAPGQASLQLESLRDVQPFDLRWDVPEMTDIEIGRSINRVLAVPEQTVRELVRLHGPVDAGEQALLAELLLGRREQMRLWQAKRAPETVIFSP